MLQKTSCHRLLATNVALKPLIDATKDSLTELSHEVQISEIPSLALVYPQLAHEVADRPFEYYPPPRRPSMLDTCIILHSSGSTRNPKAIFQTHLSWIHLILSRMLLQLLISTLNSHFGRLSAEMRVHNPRLVLGSMGLPPFHAFGIAMHIFFPTYGVLATAVFPPTSVPGGSPVQPSPQSVLEHCKSTKANALFTAPAFIQAWSTMPQAIDFLKELEFLVSLDPLVDCSTHWISRAMEADRYHLKSVISLLVLACESTPSTVPQSLVRRVISCLQRAAIIWTGNT